MKEKLFLVLSALMLAGMGNLSSYEDSFVFNNAKDKIYVSPEQVVISSEGIFVVTEGEVVAVQGILHDCEGTYYLRMSIYWTCRRCGYTDNPAWTSYCEQCKRHYNDDSVEEDENKDNE